MERYGRDFDYGVGDDIDHAIQTTRAQIAAQIRAAAQADPDAPRHVQAAYAVAIRIAEGRRQ